MQNVDNQMPRVQKRNHSLEDFDNEKLLRVLHAAGLDEEKSQHVIENVIKQLMKLADTTVTSLTIRDMVQVELNKIEPHVADLFRWYEKTKEKSLT